MKANARRLAAPLARRMAPLALLAGVVVGVLLPWIYRDRLLAERSREAAVRARQVAGRLETFAQVRPRLWPFDTARLRAETRSVTERPVRGHVRVDIPQEDAVFTAGGTPRASDVVAWAPIRVGGATIGRIEVRLGAAGDRALTTRLWIGAGAVGGLLAAGLFLIPLLAARRGDDDNAELWSALESANATLEARVRARTAELAQRGHQLEELGARLVAVQEEERARISRDLHDDLGQVLTGLRLQLTAARAALGEQHAAAPLLDASLIAVDDGVEQVRNLAHRLRPAALDGLGLRSALRDHAQRWAQQARLELTLALGEADPSGEQASVLFRLVQEALTNIARHAEASQVVISLGPADDGWQITVDDDGQGLPDEVDGGLGLVGARERVEQAGGYLDLETAPLGGLRLLAWLPLES
jgi:signal transduction histidine kinase